MAREKALKQLDFIGSSREDLKEFPEEVRQDIGYALIVYVLHCFQKKSKHGIKTPQPDIDLIKRRLRVAEEDYQINYK